MGHHKVLAFSFTTNLTKTLVCLFVLFIKVVAFSVFTSYVSPFYELKIAHSFNQTKRKRHTSRHDYEKEKFIYIGMKPKVLHDQLLVYVLYKKLGLISANLRNSPDLINLL